MSEQQNIKTEKPTWSYPSSRQTTTAYDNPQTLKWVKDVPAGKMPAGFFIDVKLTTVGAGMSLTRVSQIFKSLKIFADGKLAVDIDQHTLDLAPIFLNWAKHQDDYADLVFAQLDTGSRVVKDDINVATGAAMYGSWDLPIPVPAAKQIRVEAELYAMTSVFGAGMTGGVPSISVVPKWANQGRRKQYNMYARQLSNVVRAAYRGIEVGAFFKTSDWNTGNNGLKLGGDLSTEETWAIQSNVGNNMLQYAAVRGSLVDGRLNTIVDPLTAADTYCIANKFDGQTSAEFAFSSATSVKALILSDAKPGTIEVQ